MEVEIDPPTETHRLEVIDMIESGRVEGSVYSDNTIWMEHDVAVDAGFKDYIKY